MMERPEELRRPRPLTNRDYWSGGNRFDAVHKSRSCRTVLQWKKKPKFSNEFRELERRIASQGRNLARAQNEISYLQELLVTGQFSPPEVTEMAEDRCQELILKEIDGSEDGNVYPSDFAIKYRVDYEFARACFEKLQSEGFLESE